jgi:hypothetical protein
MTVDATARCRPLPLAAIVPTAARERERELGVRFRHGLKLAEAHSR